MSLQFQESPLHKEKLQFDTETPEHSDANSLAVYSSIQDRGSKEWLQATDLPKRTVSFPEINCNFLRYTSCNTICLLEIQQTIHLVFGLPVRRCNLRRYWY